MSRVRLNIKVNMLCRLRLSQEQCFCECCRKCVCPQCDLANMMCHHEPVTPFLPDSHKICMVLVVCDLCGKIPVIMLFTVSGHCYVTSLSSGLLRLLR